MKIAQHFLAYDCGCTSGEPLATTNELLKYAQKSRLLSGLACVGERIRLKEEEKEELLRRSQSNELWVVFSPPSLRMANGGES
jgi:hypothetical protein